MAHTAATRHRARTQAVEATPEGRDRILPKSKSAWLRPAAIALILFEASGCAHTPQSPGVAQWTYPEGPSWGPECAAPSPPQQSPIDLTRVTTTPWNTSAVVTQTTFDRHDQNVVFLPSPGPSVSIAPGVGQTTQALTYTVAGFHFHSRNEHVTPGNPFFEMHIKTTDQFGGTAVFAALWTPDAGAAEDVTLTSAHRSVSSPPESVAAVDIGRILWMFGQQPFYSYVGSLTTPPCTTGIRWFVLKTPIRTSPGIVARLNALLVERGVPPNNVRSPRPVPQPQPVVYLVTPNGKSGD